jgi:hypothetical protein
VVEKVGFKRGELRKNAYQRGIDVGTDVKRDIRVWNFDKPKQE